MGNDAGLVAELRKHAAAADRGGVENVRRAAAAGARRADRADDREIGPIPEVVDPARRERCRTDFRQFCLAYFAETFYMGFSEAHDTLVKRVESVVTKGGRYIPAFPRGYGKTTICEIAALWATLYGWRRFVVIIGSDEGAAGLNMDTIQQHLADNDALLEDFPEVCYPIRCLDGIKQRAAGQTSGGERTRIGLRADCVVFPTVLVDGKATPTSGSAIQTRGITGRIRGMKRPAPGGGSIRPDLALVDDPQTDESAASPAECDKRERLIRSAVLRLAGPGKEIAVLMPSNVIRYGDMVHRFLDADRNPTWSADRIPMLKSVPTEPARKLWLGEYREMRKRCEKELRARQCAEFYQAHPEMREGAEATWSELYNRDDGVQEVDAIQHAMNIWVDDGEEVFLSECQNTPPDPIADPASRLDAEAVARRLARTRHGEVPRECHTLTAFIDCGGGRTGSGVHYVVTAWGDGASGVAIDYGEFQANFATAKDGPEVELRRTLTAVGARILGKEYEAEKGQKFRVELCAVDAGYLTETVYTFCRECEWRDRVVPSLGSATKPGKDLPPPPKGYRRGDGWKYAPTKSTEKSGLRVLTIDTVFWKNWTFERLRVDMGSPGRLAIWGNDPSRHWGFASEVASEYRERMTSELTGASGYRWDVIPGAKGNHYWDCLVGASACANLRGIALASEAVEVRKTVKKSAGAPRNSVRRRY